MINMDFSELIDILNTNESNNLLVGNGFGMALDCSFSGIIEMPDNDQTEWDEAYLKKSRGKILRVADSRQNNGFTTFYKKICNAQRRNKADADGNEILTNDEIKSCASFLLPFQRGKIFSINYDMLILWTCERADELGINIKYNDGFDGTKFIGGSDSNVFYLHGAFNLRKFPEEKLDKASHSIKEMEDLIGKGELLLVADEEDGKHKLDAIYESSYLTWCYKQFETLSGNLVMFGVGLNNNDQHLWNAVEKAQKDNGLKVYYGLHDDDLNLYKGIRFSGIFSSDEAHVWR